MDKTTVKIGLCQMKISEDKQANLQRAEEMIAQAASLGADFVLLPEMFVCPFANANFRPSAEPPMGPAVRRMGAQAARRGVYLIAGSVPEIQDGKVYNTSYLFDRQGQVVARHRKIHLFDAVLKDGTVHKESAAVAHGDQVTVTETEFGTAGLAICFDVRFAELFRLMGNAGAKMIFLPAAFNHTTGPAHWEITLRMRALDQQCFVAACAPAQDETCVYHSWGHSMVTGPSGQVILDAGEDECVSVAEIDLNEIELNRRILPIVSGRRTDVYDTIRQ